MRRKINIIIIALLFINLFALNPTYSEDVILLDKTSVQENAVENGEEVNPDEITTTPKTANIIEQSASWPYQNDLKSDVAPQPKQELIRVLLAFLKVMLAVLICSVIIFFLALIARKFYGIQDNSKTENNPDALKTPSNSEDALKSFLNKTQQ